MVLIGVNQCLTGSGLRTKRIEGAVGEAIEHCSIADIAIGE